VSKILQLKEYDLVFTTSFENTHGVSGHLYEMIDYFHVCRQNQINCAILLSDGTTKTTLIQAIQDKYNFTEPELEQFATHTIECAQPKVIITHALCVVDGAPRFDSCTIYADHVILLRCAAYEFDYFHQHKTIKHTWLLQDFNVYDERYCDLDITVVDYNKKILWNRYQQPQSVATNTALLYLTTNCRGLDPRTIQAIIDRKEHENYLILTNNVDLYQSLTAPNVTLAQVPVQDIFNRFDTYIYTAIPNQFDCSPRFIVECAVFGKQVQYEIDYVDAGIEARKRAIAQDLNSLLLTNNDYFLELVKAL